MSSRRETGRLTATQEEQTGDKAGQCVLLRPVVSVKSSRQMIEMVMSDGRKRGGAKGRGTHASQQRHDNSAVHELDRW